MQIRCWDELVRYGVHDILKREYGSLVRAQPEDDYNVSLEIDLEQLPPEGGMYHPLSEGTPRSYIYSRTTRYIHQVLSVVEAQCSGGTI